MPTENGNFHIYTTGARIADAACDRLCDGDHASTAWPATGNPETRRGRHHLLRRWRDQPGRRQRGARVRRELPDARAVLPAEQPVGDLGPRVAQSRTPLYLRAGGFGIPGIQIDGNDVLISYAASRASTSRRRARGGGPRFIEALTYRMGAHTSSDDPTKYRSDEETAHWATLDPDQPFRDLPARPGRGRRVLRRHGSRRPTSPTTSAGARSRSASACRRPMFDHVYSEPHPLVAEQKEWLANYEASLAAESRPAVSRARVRCRWRRR